MIGKTISHYKILEKLGEGGMGVVYKAEDTKLKREVAIKFLPGHIATNSEERKRFEIEAQAAASLNHPNIATIYAIEDVDDHSFIVMEYINGPELRAFINGEPLTIEKVIDISIQIGEGLQAAHKKGIVHRDIKSANIMLSGTDQVKIMDFGLARVHGGAQLTKAGSTLGTAAYMSPEQARGEHIDHRSDIWSFGVVLYEMLTGQMAFRGDYEQAVIYSILNEEPEPLSQLRADVPVALQQIVERMLGKVPDHRYQDMKEVIADLTDLEGKTQKQASTPKRATSQPTPSIAVLPFINMSTDPENEYFSDGLTEEIIADLSNVRDLRVISRTSVMMLKGTAKTIASIGRELNVRFVLEGSVRKAGNKLRITAQLIDVRDDTHLWAEKYSGTIEDVFDIQETLSRKIVDALKMKLRPEEDRHIAERRIDNVQAYEYYHRARQEIWLWSEHSLDRARQLLESGLEIVGPNATLYAALGYVDFQYINAGIRPDERYLEDAKSCAEKVLDLDPASSHGQVLRALINYKQTHLQQAVRDLKQALTNEPNNPDTLAWLVYLYAFSGKVAAARPLVKKLLQIDPLTPVSHHRAGWMELLDGQFEAALGYFQKMYELEPTRLWPRWAYAFALALNQRLDEAYPLLDRTAQEAPETFFAGHAVFLKYVLQRNRSKALQAVNPELTRAARWDEQFSWMMASCYALIDEKKEALDWLDNAIHRGFINYPFLSKFDPTLKNLRRMKRFKELMEKVKYEWERFEA